MNIFSKTLKVLAVVGAFSFLLASCGFGDGNSGNDAAPPQPSGSTEWTISYSTAYGTAPASKNVADGYKLTAADLPTLSKEGHVFNGWSKSVGFEIKANTTITALWGESNYTVTFDANGGSGTMENQTFVFGTTQALNENKFLPPVGKKFSGWSTTAEGSSEYADKADFTIGAADTTLYAIWIDKDAHGITYNLDGGTNAASNPSSFLETEAVTIADPAKANYTFKGWYTASDFSGSAVTGWAAGDKTSDVELYAKWEAVSYTITYNLNSGTNAASNPASFIVEDTVTLADPTRTDYTFKGWYTTSDYSGTAISGWSAGEKTADVELYAKWDWDYARLKAGEIWYDTRAAAKDTITKIKFQKEPYAGSYTESWDAGENAGEITAYLNGTELIISSNGKKMRANASCKKMFYYFEKVSSIDISCLDTKYVTDMTYMFCGCKALTDLDVSNFDTRNVTDMTYMFCSCHALTDLDVSNFDTRNVTAMECMFMTCKALTDLDVSRFGTSKVTTMNTMFYGCHALTSLDVSNFDTRNVTDMALMFYGCHALTSLDVSNFDTRNVTDMQRMFWECKTLTSLDLSSFDTSKVTIMYAMFNICTALETIYVDPSKFVTAQVTNSTNMFSSCYNLSGAIAHDDRKTDKTYANTTTGYFTAK